jgi:glycerate kinase
VFRSITVEGPMGDPVQASWLKLPDGTAVIEMAKASGLRLVAVERRDVRRASTYGTGELIRAALDEGCEQFIIGIGGSATNDGGMGMLRALGERFFGPKEELRQPAELDSLQSMDFTGLDRRIARCGIRVACDVGNPLCGPQGASAIFGPQKGAAPCDIEAMDRCLKRLAEVASGHLGMDLSGSAGAGAAGGLGWALMQCCGAQMVRGIDVVLDAAGFDTLLADASLVVTGEGSLDSQTALGKVPVGIAERASKFGVPVAVLAGRLTPGYELVYQQGIGCAQSILSEPMPLNTAMENAESLLEASAMRLARTVAVGMRIKMNKGGMQS